MREDGEDKRPGVFLGALPSIAVFALLFMAACTGPKPQEAEKRIFFCDDLRVHSLRPDGTGLWEFPGKSTTSPLPIRRSVGIWRILVGSYRGPYLFLDAPRPGLYACSLAGGARRRITDLPGLPVIAGLASDGSHVILFLPGAESLEIVDTWTGARRSIPVPAPVRAAAVDPRGERVAVILESKLRTVMLGNQAWFTEGSDLILVDLASGKITALAYTNLPDPLGAEPKLEFYAGSGMAAVAWYYPDTLIVSSAPGLWTLKLVDPPICRMAKPRLPGLPPADGIAVDKKTSALALTCGGKLLVWDLTTGDAKDITPVGDLIGGAHHPVWLEP